MNLSLAWSKLRAPDDPQEAAKGTYRAERDGEKANPAVKEC